MKRKTRMYEPWGYRDENNYESSEVIRENDLGSFFSDVNYNKDDNKIHFQNKDGEEVASLDVNEFVKSDSIIDHTEYKDGILKIYFTNGDVITINLSELLDENEFKNGLQVVDHVISVLVDDSSDKYLSVSENGVKVAGIEADIEAEEARATSAETALDEKIDAEIARAISAETVLDIKIDQEIADRIADVDEEETRATGEEQRIEAKLDGEITRAKEIEQSLNSELDSEEVAREAGDAALGVRIDNEINDRKADVNEEEARAKAAEEALQGAIDVEVARATSAETALQAAIEAEGQRAISAETDLQTAIDLKADKETTYTKEDVDALLLAKENEIYNLTKIVGDIGGAVTYDLPNLAGKSFNTLMNNNGTVKLTDDVTTGRFGPGITAKNKVKLNLNNNDLTITGLTITSVQSGIMARGSQEITIYGKGTIDAGNGICIEANGKDSIINLTGSTTIYENDRSGGELIYCYAGTINITNGTFRNNGNDKKFLLNCYDANRADGTAKIIVTGGKFYDFDPMHNTAEGPDTNFLAEGYHTEASTVVEEGVEHTVYTVKKDV